jgi:Methylamine utilisation protein MauE
MAALVLGCKAGLAVLLLVAGAAKLADLTGFGSAIKLFLPPRLPPRPAARVSTAGASAVAVTELGLGLGSLGWPASGWLNLAVLAIAAGFVAVAAAGLALHHGRSCGCLGTLSQRSFGPRGLAQAVAIATAAALATRQVQAAQLRIDLAAQVLLLAAAGLTALVAFTAARVISRHPPAIAGQPRKAG